MLKILWKIGQRLQCERNIWIMFFIKNESRWQLEQRFWTSLGCDLGSEPKRNNVLMDITIQLCSQCNCEQRIIFLLLYSVDFFHILYKVAAFFLKL